ncbi:Uncharacterized protein FWK35_00030139, partial [Aphis craccivora]
QSFTHDLPSNCSFDISDVEKGLSRLKGNNSIGPDGISGDFLFSIRSSICFPLWLLFRKSLDSRSYPEILKLSSITPIFKSGDISNVANYRPITIISHIGKLFESLVLSSIQAAVNQIIIDEQHGFRPNWSVNTCNLVFTDYVFDAFAKKNQVDVIYTDFSKAFARVNHAVLMRVLANSGFGEPLLSWFSSYLSDRKQSVKIFGIKSQKVIHHSKFLLFADDLKLFLEIRSEQDCQLLQNDLYALDAWAVNIGLDFNVSKCCSKSFYRGRTHLEFKSSLRGTYLVIEYNTVKDLGVFYDSNLNFHNHIDATCCKALKALGFLKLVCNKFKLITPLKAFYGALIRSILEFSVIIWNPHNASNMNQLERVQRKFLSFSAYLLNIEHSPHDYDAVMDRLGLQSLADRRITINKVFLVKLINGLIDCPELLSKVNFKIPCVQVRSSYPFSIPLCTTNYSRNKPLNRMMRLANEDPSFNLKTEELVVEEIVDNDFEFEQAIPLLTTPYLTSEDRDLVTEKLVDVAFEQTKVSILRLPHVSAIQNWTSSINGNPGFLSEVLLYLKNLPTVDKDCNLVFDAMAIKKQIVWDKKLDKFVIFSDYANELDLEGNNTPATEVLVFMLVSLNWKWKCPVGYFFQNKINTSTQAELIKTALTVAHDAGLRVRGITCDGTYVNFSTMKIFGCEFENIDIYDNIKCWIDHPVSGEEVFFVSDACHVLKLARNTLGNAREHIEILFARFRQRFGANNNPNVLKFKVALKQILLNNAIKWYVVRKISKHIDCDSCIQSLLLSQTSIEHAYPVLQLYTKLISLKNFGGLFLSSEINGLTEINKTETSLSTEFIIKQAKVEEYITSLHSKQREVKKACLDAAKCKSSNGRRCTTCWVYECLLMCIKSPKL